MVLVLQFDSHGLASIMNVERVWSHEVLFENTPSHASLMGQEWNS